MILVIKQRFFSLVRSCFFPRNEPKLGWECVCDAIDQIWLWIHVSNNSFTLSNSANMRRR